MSRTKKQPAPSPVVDQVLVTREVAARRLSISERTLWTLTNSGAIPSIRLGTRAVRYRVADLDAWVAAGCPTAPRPRR